MRNSFSYGSMWISDAFFLIAASRTRLHSFTTGASPDCFSRSTTFISPSPYYEQAETNQGVHPIGNAKDWFGSSFNVDVFPERKRDGSVSPVPVKRQVLVTGDQFVGAHIALRLARIGGGKEGGDRRGDADGDAHRGNQGGWRHRGLPWRQK